MPQKRNKLTFPLFNSPIPYRHAVVCCLTSAKLSSMYTKVRGAACTVQQEIILISTQVLIRMTFPTCLGIQAWKQQISCIISKA